MTNNTKRTIRYKIRASNKEIVETNPLMVKTGNANISKGSFSLYIFSQVNILHSNCCFWKENNLIKTTRSTNDLSLTSIRELFSQSDKFWYENIRENEYLSSTCNNKHENHEQTNTKCLYQTLARQLLLLQNSML